MRTYRDVPLGCRDSEGKGIRNVEGGPRDLFAWKVREMQGGEAIWGDHGKSLEKPLDLDIETIPRRC